MAFILSVIWMIEIVIRQLILIKFDGFLTNSATSKFNMNGSCEYMKNEALFCNAKLWFVNRLNVIWKFTILVII